MRLGARPDGFGEPLSGWPLRAGTMLARLERLGNQLPPRLKAVLNLTISVALLLFAVPLLWLGLADAQWGNAAMGLGLVLLSVFNLFT